MEMCSESGYGVVGGVGGCTEYLRDGIHPESESEKVVENGVPLQFLWLWLLLYIYLVVFLLFHSSCKYVD